MKETISTKVEPLSKKEMERRAAAKGMKVSAYVASLIEDDIAGPQRIDLILNKIMDELLQIEAMLSVMMGVNTEALSTLLGRSEKEFAAPEEKKKAINQRNAAMAYLKEVINKTVNDVSNGEYIWG